MSDPFKCDVCGTIGRRRKGAFVPEGWYYGEMRNEESQGGDGEVYVLGVCSTPCRDAFWKPGPGKLNLSDLSSGRRKEGELDVP